MTGAVHTAAYRDPRLPVADRVQDLVQRMRLDEKIAHVQLYVHDAQASITRPVKELRVSSASA
jgi:hypothetical protein